MMVEAEGSSKRSFIAQLVGWFVWLFLSGQVASGVASAAVSGPGHVDEAGAQRLLILVLVIRAVILGIAGFVGGRVVRDRPRPVGSVFAPPAVAIGLSLFLAAVLLIAQSMPLSGLVTLVPSALTVLPAVLGGLAIAVAAPKQPHDVVEKAILEDTFDSQSRAD